MRQQSYRLPFIRFDYTAEEIPQVIQRLIEETGSEYRKIESIPINDCTFENVVSALSEISSRNNEIISPVTFLQHVSIDDKIREASRQAELDWNSFCLSIDMKEDIYLRVCHVHETYAEILDSLKLRLLEGYLDGYRATGLHLRKNRRDRLCFLMQEKDRLESEFQANMAEDTTHLILTTSELNGMDPSFLKRTKVKSSSLHKITHDYPDVGPVLSYCNNPETRSKVLDMSQNRCLPNLNILSKLHRLRTQIANELGYATSSDYRLTEEMVNNKQQVKDFLELVLSELQTDTRDFVELLRQMKCKDLLGPSSETRTKRRKIEATLNHSDFNFYNDRYLKEVCNVDQQEIKKYFPSEYVIEKMLEFYSEMFHLRFVKRTTYNEGHRIPGEELRTERPWNNDVLTYSVYDTDGVDYGYFMMDLYPRPGKYNHFAVWNLIGGTQLLQGCQTLPVSAMLCNFPSPTEDEPSLLNMGEVQTLFHEFGHVLHNLCGGAKCVYHELSGTNTETDFVEAPSQMKEQWVFEPAVLARISKHYQTGQSLPSELITRLSDGRYKGACYNWSRISSMAMVDLTISSQTKVNEKSMVKIMNDIMEKYLFMPYDNGNRLASWGHLGGGYDSKYYSYVWTMVLACDLYSRFKTNPLDRDIGLEYREHIMSPGATLDGIEMIRNFLGREPSIQSFLTHYIGIKKPFRKPHQLVLQVHDKTK